MFTRKLKMSSKTQLIVILLIFVIPMVVFFVSYNIITVNTINNRIAQSNESMIYIYQDAITTELDNITKYMLDMTTMNSDFQQLCNKRSGLEAYLNAYGVRKSYKTILNIQPLVSGFFIYSRTNSILQSTYNNGENDYDEKVKIEEFAKSELQDGKTAHTGKWFLKLIGNHYFLFQILGNKGTYTVCFIKLDDIKNINEFNSDSEGILLFSDNKGNPLTSVSTVLTEKVNLKTEARGYYISGGEKRYMIVQKPVEDLDINIVYMVSYHGSLYYMDQSQELLLLASVIIVLMIPVCYCMLQHSYLKPLSQLVRTMNQIKAGKLDTKMISHYNIVEFESFSNTFNEMMEQIQYFKISVYEKEIESQNARLQYLQIQIRPHFFLNCLKNIYAMAQEGKREEIQEMVLALSVNYRYMLRDSFTLVPLSLEIENVKNYINIQKMSHSYRITCISDIEPELEGFEIPPISVLTFVENSLKHGIYANRPMNIYIKARLLISEDGNCVNITISDDGKGFSEENLKSLNGNGVDTTGEHIGISNVKHRFSIIYDNKSTIAFLNQANGACVEIFIPHYNL